MAATESQEPVRGKSADAGLRTAAVDGAAGRHELSAQIAPDDLRRRVFSSIAWRGMSRVFLELSKIGVLLVLARLLTPAEFGVAAEVLVVSGLIPIFSGLALGAGLIQMRDPDELDWATAFWASLALSAVATGACFAAAGTVADFFGEPEVKPLLQAFSAVFLIGGFTTIQTQMLIRALNYRALEIRTMIGTAVGAVVAIAAALRGAGAWAIILQHLAASVVMTALLWRFSPWRPQRAFSWTRFKRLGRFGTNVSGTLLFGEATRNANNILIGRFLGAHALGIYSISYTAILLPFSRLTAPLMEVLYPAFARISDDAARVESLWLRANRVVAAIAIPALAGLALTAPDFVHVVLGSRWEDAVHVLQILCWVGLLQAVQGLNASILQARDRTGPQLRLAAISSVLNIAAFAVGLRWGVVGVAVCFAISTTLAHPLYVAVTTRALGRPFVAFYRALRGVVEAAGAMAAAIVGIQVFMSEPSHRLVASAVVGASVYVLACAWRAPELLQEVRGVLQARRAAAATMATASDPGR